MKKVSQHGRGRLPVRPDTKRKILDAAEVLFAARGYHATSLRAITAAAKVNLAAVHYHFGSKPALLEAVIARRLGPLNAERRARLASLPASAETNAIVRALVEPVLALRDAGPGARHFLALVGRAMVEADESVRSVFLTQMQELLEPLLARLAATLPQLSGREVCWRLFFSLGTLAHTLRMADKFRQLPLGVEGDVATGDLVDMLTRFITSGMEQPPFDCQDQRLSAGDSP